MNLIIPEEGKGKLLALIIVMVPLALLFSEMISFFWAVKFGLILYVVFLFFILFFSSWLEGIKEKTRAFSLRRAWELEKPVNLLKVLLLIPLLRTINFSIPGQIPNPADLYLLVAVPFFLGVYLLLKNLKLSVRNIGLALPPTKFQLLLQVMVALTGLGLGFLGYLVLKPNLLLSSSLPLETLIVSGAIVILISGILEELLFRGIIQRYSEDALGNFRGLLFAAGLFTIMQVGFRSLLYLLFAFIVGLFYGIIFQKTRNLWGISLSHGIINFILLGYLPLI